MRNNRNDSLQPNSTENPAPHTAKGGATKNFFVAFVKPLSDKFTLLVIVAILGVVVVVQGISMASMASLERHVPYFLDVEKDASGKETGRVYRTDRVAAEFVPTDANKRYFLKQWLLWTMTIDQKRTRTILLPKASSWTRGNATQQLIDWTDKKEKLAERMERDPTLTREVDADSVTILFTSKTQAVAHFTTIERSMGAPREPVRWIVTLEHALVPVKDEKDEYDNPIGLTITGFVAAMDQEQRQ